MKCARCDFHTDPADEALSPREQLAAHATDAAHPLCLLCGTSLTIHEPRVCESDLTAAQEHLAGIVVMFTELPTHLGHLRPASLGSGGRESDGKPLPGGAALVMLAGGSQGLSDDWHTVKEGDEPSISTELGFWAIAVQDARDEPRPLGHTPHTIVVKAAGYLETRLHWASVSFEGFAELAADLKRLHRILERHTGRSLPHEKANADCFACGGDLIRRYSPTTGLADEHHACVRCHQTYTAEQYALALRASWEASLEGWVPLAVAVKVTGRSRFTIEAWVRRELVASSCQVGDGRRLYVWWPDVRARLNRSKETA